MTRVNVNAEYADLLTAGTFTPTVDFATTGDFVPTYSTQAGTFSTSGSFVLFSARVVFDTNAYTTASGPMIVEGLPFADAETGDVFNSITLGPFGNVTFAGIDNQLVAYTQNTDINIRILRSASSSGDFDTDNVPPSTSNVQLSFTGYYKYDPEA